VKQKYNATGLQRASISVRDDSEKKIGEISIIGV